ncbi:MAG: MarR family transcriptional regulator [Polyangiaceae bacterium]
MKEKEDLGVLLALAYATFVEELRADLAREGYDDIHRSFGYVARALAEKPLLLRDLAARLGVTSQGALKIVDEMEATGYVLRRPDPDDARAKRLYLSKRGEAALAAARRFHKRFESSLRTRIGAKGVDLARAMLDEIVAESERAGRTTVLRQV